MADASQAAPFLSIVIPAYNEEQRILPTLQQLDAYLATQSYIAEIVVVDDGSADATTQVVLDYAATHRNVRLIGNPHHGKGYAVKTGMLAATGQFRFLCDADLSMPAEQLERFLPPRLTAFDIAVGSREAVGARRYDEPPYRHLMGRIFNLLVQAVAVPGIRDTQCGFKCFRAAVAEAVFPLQRIDGFAFDVEVLFLARQSGFRLVEIPIDWYFGDRSTVRPVADTLRMFKETLGIRWRALRGGYRER